jgi:DNA-binding transcriptional LysR family regulator
MTRRLFAKSGLSLERLRTFVQVVEAAGISNAAPGDANRQSQFSRQLRDLEEFFGAELLLRGRGRFELTPTGRELFQIVLSHFTAMEDLANRCMHQNVEVTVGAGESLFHWLLLPIFASFRSQHPFITLVLQNLRTEEITGRLVDGRIDLGLLRQEVVRAPLKSTRLGSIEYRLVLPDVSAQITDSNALWPVLAQRPIALLAGSDVTAAFEAEAEKKRVRLNVCLRGSSYAQLLEAVRQTKCAAVLPTFAIGPYSSTTVVLPHPALKPFRRMMALAWNPRSCVLRPALETTIESLTVELRRKLSAT